MPGLPWITAQKGDDLQRLRLTIKSFFSESTYKSVYKPLRINGFSILDDINYQPVGKLAAVKSHALVAPLLC